MCSPIERRLQTPSRYIFSFQRLAFPIFGPPRPAFITICKNIIYRIHRQYLNLTISLKIRNHSLHLPKNCIRANLSRHHVTISLSCCMIRDSSCVITRKILIHWNESLAFPQRSWLKHMEHSTRIIVLIVGKSIQWNGLKMKYSPTVYPLAGKSSHSLRENPTTYLVSSTSYSISNFFIQAIAMGLSSLTSCSLAKNCQGNFTLCHPKILESVIY